MAWSHWKRFALAVALAAQFSLSLAQAQDAEQAARPYIQQVSHAPSCCVPGGCATIPQDVVIPDGSEAPIRTDNIASTFGGSSGAESPAPYMIGDSPGFLSPNAPNTITRFKMADNESAAPNDRVYVNYSYFNDVNGDTQIHRWNLGGERMLGDGMASVGLRLPVHMVDPGTIGGFSTFGTGTGTQSDLGDLTLIFKYALMNNAAGDWATLGITYTAPTGPDTIADVDTPVELEADHRGSIQPYFAGIRFLGSDFFLQVFSSMDIPIDHDDSTIWFNDIQIGQYLRTYRSSGLTAIIPCFEVHVASPVNNRVIETVPAGFGTSNNIDQVDLTWALTFVFNDTRSVALAVVSPVGNSALFDYELQAQVNLFGF